MQLLPDHKPQRIFLDKKAGVVFIRHYEIVDGKGLLSSAQELNALAGLKPGFGSLVDFRGCREFNLSADDMRALDDYVNKELTWRGVFPLAIIAPSKLMHGMARLYESLLDTYTPNTSIFEEVGPALEWVGLSADYILPYELNYA
jgi:hypothetical protein